MKRICLTLEAPKGRINEVDYLKCVFILLMIAFHLTYIGNSYPYAKQIVYTFHIPGFLLISGYFASISKRPLELFLSMLWIFIPYAIMEAGYTVAASYLPIKDHIEELSLIIVLRNVFVTPLGPYWYLHTLMLCSATYYIVMRKPSFNGILILCVIFWFYSEVLHIASFANECYFLAGAVIKCCGVSFLRFFRHSWIAVVPILIAMFMYPDCWYRVNIVGVVLVYLVISLLLAAYPYIRGKNILLFLGRNTFIIFIFSPIFTVLTKVYQPYIISFDKSGMLFLLISIPFVLIGSFIVARILEFIPQSSCFLRKVKCAE